MFFLCTLGGWQITCYTQNRKCGIIKPKQDEHKGYLGVRIIHKILYKNNIQTTHKKNCRFIAIR
jgi:hypothetical protein